MLRLALSFVLMVAAVFAVSDAALAQQPYEFKLGFKVLADMIPGNVGEPLENEHYNSNGDSVQRTTNGLMVWRNADNWTAFTDGSKTAVNGPNGLEWRLNSERFYWEPWEPGTQRLPPHQLDLPAQNAWELVQFELLDIHEAVDTKLKPFWDINGVYQTTFLSKITALQNGIQACGLTMRTQSELCNCMLLLVPVLDDAEQYWSGAFLGSWMVAEGEARSLVRDRLVELRGRIMEYQRSGELLAEEVALLEASANDFERWMLEYIPMIRRQVETHNAGALPALRQILEAPCKQE